MMNSVLECNREEIREVWTTKSKMENGSSEIIALEPLAYDSNPIM